MGEQERFEIVPLGPTECEQCRSSELGHDMQFARNELNQLHFV